ncbi:MAG TPA: hypothetical protein VLW50_25325 [Streptosporangiaceae bacterium]|nr:hypothetical protein [Streptosporangiaceae bacterium]
MTTTQTGHLTGTVDADYHLIWYAEACLRTALQLETFIQDAERTDDSELAEFFRKAQADSRKGADLGKQLLGSRLRAEVLRRRHAQACTSDAETEQDLLIAYL